MLILIRATVTCRFPSWWSINFFDSDWRKIYILRLFNSTTSTHRDFLKFQLFLLNYITHNAPWDSLLCYLKNSLEMSHRDSDVLNMIIIKLLSSVRCDDDLPQVTSHEATLERQPFTHMQRYTSHKHLWARGQLATWLAGPSLNQRVVGSIPALVDVSLSKTLNPEWLPLAVRCVTVTCNVSLRILKKLYI